MSINMKVFGKEICERSLAYNNRVRIAVNKMWMAKHVKGKKHVVIGAIEGREKETQEILLYKDLPIVAIETCRRKANDFSVANGEEYIVLGFNQTARTVTIAPTLEDGSADKEMKMQVDMDTFGKYFQPAYCLSIHRSQGSSFNFPYTIYQVKKMKDMVARGDDTGSRLLYVALSRATKMSNINVSDRYD